MKKYTQTIYRRNIYYIIYFITYILTAVPASATNTNSNTFDGSGNAINSFVTGPRRGLSVNVENLIGISSSAASPVYANPAFGGIPIDPRTRLWNTDHLSDSETCYEGGAWTVSSKLQDNAANGLTSTAVSAKRGLDVNIISSAAGGDASAANQTTEIARLTSILSALGGTLTTTTSGTVTANIGSTAGLAADSTVATMSAKLPSSLGQHISSSSMSVVPASDYQPPNTKGRSVVTTSRNDYTSTNVTTSAWVQLVASSGNAINEIEVFDSSGQTLEIGTGGSGSEVRLIIVFPGGNGRVPVSIPISTRISIRAISATANAGESDINFYN